MDIFGEEGEVPALRVLAVTRKGGMIRGPLGAVSVEQSGRAVSVERSGGVVSVERSGKSGRAVSVKDPVIASGSIRGSPLKYHEDIWMSGAVNLLKGEPNTSYPDKWARKLQEQAQRYRITFGKGGCPLAIYSVPIVGSLIYGKPMEVPAPARRVTLVAEAHELGHFGADKTAQRVRDLGFDWLGLEQDCKAIISTCRPCARDNAHRVLWAPALSLVVPKRVF